jgi:hypothetical protein
MIQAAILSLLVGASTAMAPTLSPASGTYVLSTTVTAKAHSSGSVIRCTTDGSTPTLSSSRYLAPITVSTAGTTTVTCRAWGQDEEASPVVSETYIITSSGGGGTWVTATGAACINSAATPCEWQPCKDETLPSVVYYACPTGGSDSRTATQARNPATPWATLSPLNKQFGSLAAGQAVALCRGGTFSGGLTWMNSNGTIANPTIIRDYVRPGGSSSDPRPSVSGDFKFNGQNIKMENVTLQLGSIGTNGALNGLTVCSVESYGALGSIGFYAWGSAAGNQNITIRGSRFIHHGLTGYLGAQGNLLIEDNYWWDNGFGDPAYVPAQRHTIYLGGTNELSVNCTVRRNVIHAANVGTTAIVTHGQHNNLVYEGNTIQFEPPVGATSAGSWGISLKCGYGCQDGTEWNHNVTIRGNTVINAGNQSINADMCSQGCLVENNLVINTQQSTVGIAVPGGDDPVSGTAQQTTGAVVRNNTVYLTGGGTGISVGGSGSGHVVENNVVQCNGACYSVSGATTNDYNAYYNCGDGVVGSHSWKRAPGWVTPGRDFHPAAGSRLIGAGDAAQSSRIDITGKARPSPPSIGAYER